MQNDESFNGLQLLYIKKNRLGSATSSSEITIDRGRPHSFPVHSPIFKVTKKKVDIEYGNSHVISR